MPQRWDAQGNLVSDSPAAPAATPKQRWDAQGNLVSTTPTQGLITTNAPTPVPEAPGLFQQAAQTQSDIAMRTAKGFGRGIAGLATQMTPTSIPQGVAGLFLGPAGLVTQKAVEAQFGEAQKARQAAEQGRTPEALAYSATAGIPVAGPLLSHIGESIGRGEIPELIGEGTAIAATGGALKGITKGAPVRSLRRTIKLDTQAKGELTKIFQPPDKDARFEQNITRAVPEIAEEARLKGGNPKNPVPSTWDFLGLLRSAKRRLWTEREQFIGPHRPAIQISGDALAKAIREGETSLMRQDNPAAVTALQNKAKLYEGKKYSLKEAESLLKDLNLELHEYYKKGPLDKLTISEAKEVSRLRRMSESLRNEIYSKVDAMAGPGVAELMKRYGSLSDLELYADPLVRRIQRYGGKDLLNMTAEAVMDTAAGGIYSKSGAIVRGMRGVSRLIKGTLDDRLATSFKRLGRYQRFAPTPVTKPIKGALPARAGGPFPLPVTATPRYAPAEPFAVLRAMFEPKAADPKLLPAGPPAAFPQPPRGSYRGMEFEGAFPLEGQVSPEPIPRTPPPAYSSGYVGEPQTSYVRGVPAEPTQPSQFPNLSQLLENRQSVYADTRARAISSLSNESLRTVHQMATANFPDLIPLIEAEMRNRGL